MATPQDGKPVKKWADIDEAFLDVAQAVRAAAKQRATKQVKPVAPNKPLAQASPFIAGTTTTTESTAQARPGPRSSNLRLAKTFTQREKDQFKAETFEYIAKHFENSLNEPRRTQPGLRRIIPANRCQPFLLHDLPTWERRRSGNDLLGRDARGHQLRSR